MTARIADGERGTIYTFYSFKGGVGRSMALANVAALLAKWGYSVLVVDWDIEAPGIERFYARETRPSPNYAQSSRGLWIWFGPTAKGRVCHGVIA